jgi:hypothetical protein
MAGLIDVGIIKPELATSFATGYNQAEQTRNLLAQQKQQAEIGQLNLERLKQDRMMLTDLQTKLQAAGKSTDPNEFFRAMIQSGNPEYMTKGYEGMQRYKELQRADEMLRREAPDLFGSAPPAPVNALGSSTPNASPASVNALAPAPVSASAEPANRVQELRNKILMYSSSGDPRLKAMADVYKAELQEMTKPQTLSPGQQLYSGGRVVYTAPREPVPVAQPAMVSEFNFARSPEGGGFQGSYQDFVIAREAAKRPPPAPRADRAPRTQQTTLSDGSIGLVNMDTGAVTPVTMGGVQVKGKPSAFAEKAAAQRVQLGKDLDFAIKELGEITKDGGLIDQSTGSGAGRLVDLGARFVGQATPGDIAIGKIAPVADLTLKMVPRFEGPQSDKDTKSYKEAAGQLADPTLPTAIRKEAGKTVLRLMIQRKGQFRTSDMAEDNANPVLDVRSQADAILNGGK